MGIISNPSDDGLACCTRLTKEPPYQNSARMTPTDAAVRSLSFRPVSLDSRVPNLVVHAGKNTCLLGAR